MKTNHGAHSAATPGPSLPSGISDQSQTGRGIPHPSVCYTWSDDAWYHQAAQLRPERRYILIMNAHEDGGVEWEFKIEERPDIGSLGLVVFHDAFAAISGIPEFFYGLAGAVSLEDVRKVARSNGFRDATRRHRGES